MAWDKQKAGPLPRPDITVAPVKDETTETTRGSVDVVISRDNKARSYRGEGNTTSEVVKDVVEKILNDPHSAEYVKES